MNRKTMLLMFSLFLLLAGCSSNEKDDSASESQGEKAESKWTLPFPGIRCRKKQRKREGMTDERKVIHQAQLELKVKNLEKAQMKIENKAAEYGGYVVESNVYREDEELVEGTITVRVPEAHFQDFLTDSEGEASEVVGRNVTGQDVTEQYVDLKSKIEVKEGSGGKVTCIHEGC
ncbi:DUF4349 domain-containing protein [Peribacillus frigoritolerans]|nr:DUF4349 domain-containing protein [Peribacillus frigoritolerans]